MLNPLGNVIDAGVAPYAGAWIEIAKPMIFQHLIPVAPYAGAWIEILLNFNVCVAVTSLPTRERGLKLA